MAVNPMQRKARNSFILGVLITFIICAIIGGLIYFLTVGNKSKTSKTANEDKQVKAYVLNQSVSSGQVITTDLLTQIVVYESMIPSDYVDIGTLSGMGVYDKEGNEVKTNSDGVMYIEKNGKKVEVTEDDFKYAPVHAKIDMNKNTILTENALVYGKVTTDDERYVEYNMLSIGTTLMEGDYVDIRITFLNGLDLIVVSKKEIQSIIGHTIGFKMTEEEINMMESAIVEAYVVTGSKFYLTKYTEPGNQAEAVRTYVPTSAVRELIESNPNIADKARRELTNKFNDNTRAKEDANLSLYTDVIKQNIEDGIKQEVENAQKAREAYLSGLESY